MDKLAYQALQLAIRNRDGSYATQYSRKKILCMAMSQLKQLGYRNMTVRSLRTKHIQALFARWREENLSVGTIKNRLSHLRWLARKIGKANIVPTNSDLGLEKRRFSCLESKAMRVSISQLEAIKDVYVRTSLQLQAAFGLRREEAIKLVPVDADCGDHITLTGSWAKGGRPRSITIRNEEQRIALNLAHKLAGQESLIPAHLNYCQQLGRFERCTAKAGISKTHGLRHLYAQTRYEELTGWKSPAAGGPINPKGYTKEERVKLLVHGGRTALLPEQRELDKKARLTISAELGHAREAITIQYLGR